MKDYFGYENKVCVVTGASSGMGKAVVELLVELGAKIYALDLNPCTVEGIEKYIHCNLASREDIDQAFQEIPDHIDSFFGVAGLSGSRTDYRTTFNCNFTSNKYIVETYLKNRMQENGSILFVSSTAGLHWIDFKKEQDKVVHASSWEEVNSAIDKLVEESPSTFAYIYSKRCLSQYSTELSVELGKKGIRVNNVMPGSTNTGMKQEFAKMAGGEEALIKEAGVANRLASSQEIAEPMIFLNSNMARFISGVGLCVDYADNALKQLNLKKDLENISATNPLILAAAKKKMESR